ncbi:MULTISPECIES: asparaginase domain-containing protein [Marinobacter]|jgi:L-asparaginase|uniref:L-asparaginase n=2 Tax=Marinobacter nauticus TaxID=2743 RepID=A0A368V846_MARNT|nr:MULTISPECIES: asparaginase domain-containing protein [Marinobacter]MEC9040151.1 asparaginase domain-containing protein [Pseudomonadota bacterium]ABM20672.1 asparaginase [Marinobacter nauticus VT8]ERS82551.1 asparaginase [Marinobacter sp. EVN1]MBW3198252.1 asparaginase [Marinobacter nauticus]MBY5936926.1 asparaginase [Marinobacter nauticus]
MIEILTTGGTIDKVYFDANSKFEIGDSLLPELLTESNIHDGYEIRPLMRKDSLELTDEDRQAILEAVKASACQRILITHGTDTMAQTAEALKSVADRTIVLTGAMQPARMRRTDAIFNIGFAWAAVSLLPAGVYIAMNGEVFEAGSVRKNLAAQRFERA